MRTCQGEDGRLSLVLRLRRALQSPRPATPPIPLTAGFLDGANAASVALMAVVTWQLARSAVVDWLTAALAVVAAGLLFHLQLSSAWLVAGGAAVGLAGSLLR
jgi:chromate transport protein ChrA